MEDFVNFLPLFKSTQYQMMGIVQLRPLANFPGDSFGIFGKPNKWGLRFKNKENVLSRGFKDPATQSWLEFWKNWAIPFLNHRGVLTNFSRGV